MTAHLGFLDSLSNENANKDGLQKGGQPRIAVIGCGNWGKNLVRNFHALGNLAAVCDLEKEALQRVQAQNPDYKALTFTTKIDKILNNPTIDGIVISTPSHTHYPLAKKAFAAGKHVYVEKPIATSVSDAQDLLRLAEAADKKLMVGHLLLYHPAVNRLKQLIQQGLLGQITYIQSDRLNFNPLRPDRSVLWDLAPHDLSMICYLMDTEPVDLTSASGHRTGTDGLVDVAHMELCFPNGVSGHIHCSWVHPTKQVKLIVRGTRYIAVLDDTQEVNKLQLFRKTPESRPDKGIEEPVDLAGLTVNADDTITPDYVTLEPLKLECQHFINAIRFNTPLRTDSANGVAVIRILEKADKLLERNACRIDPS